MTDRPQRMFSAREVLKAQNYPKATLYMDRATGRLPNPAKVSPMRNSWPEPDLITNQQVLIVAASASRSEYREAA
jgi:hypothetical protein